MMNNTKMKAEVILLTPQVAKNLLSRNTENRMPRIRFIKTLADDMINGFWKENGEAIIVDKNGIVKDGQHRLYATIEANYSYYCPIITGVEPDVSETIDSGLQRSLADYLQMRGIKMAGAKASVTKAVYVIEKEVNPYRMSGGVNVKKQNKETTPRFVDFYFKHQQYIDWLVSKSESVYKQEKKIGNLVFSATHIAGFYHMFIPWKTVGCQQVDEFIEEICGIRVTPKTGTQYVFTTVLNAKKEKTPLSSTYVNALVIKAWNLYMNGNPEIKYLRYNKSENLEIKHLSTLVFEDN